MIKGWIVYNGALRIKKVEALVHRMKQQAESEGIDLTIRTNNSLLPIVYGGGKLGLLDAEQPEAPEVAPNAYPDFVLFWDKDIHLANHLEAMGLRLFNSAKAVEICDDKALTHLHLAKLPIPMPETIIGPFVFRDQQVSDAYLETAIRTLGEELILKETKGSFGMQVYKVRGKDELRDKMAEMGSRPFLLQRFIRTSYGRDIRVNIVGDRIVGAMERSNPDDFRANITLGANGTPIELTAEQANLALQAHQALGLDFSGVDLLFGEAGNPILCEINSNVNFLSFEQVTGINFASLILQHIRGVLEAGR